MSNDEITIHRGILESAYSLMAGMSSVVREEQAKAITKSNLMQGTVLFVA
jgi:hypothetical protein